MLYMWASLYLLVLGETQGQFAFWVTHSVGASLRSPRVGPSKTCATNPTHTVCMVVYTGEAWCCACRWVRKWINEGVGSIVGQPKTRSRIVSSFFHSNLSNSEIKLLALCVLYIFD